MVNSNDIYFEVEEYVWIENEEFSVGMLSFKCIIDLQFYMNLQLRR